MLAATLPAKVGPAQVSTGTPDHKASLAVVCALYGKVSRNPSARRCRAGWSDRSGRLEATTSRSGETPLAPASRRKFSTAAGEPCRSHRTLPGIARRQRIQISKMVGVSLYKLLRLQ